MKAVFFDFDNTLVDSASVLPYAQRRVAGEIARFLNGSVDVDMVFGTVKYVERVLEMQGLYDRDRIWMHVLWELGFDGRVDDGLLRSWSLAYWEEFMKGEVFPETVEVLERLSKHYSLGVVTNTDGLYGMKRMRMEKKGLNRFFKVIVVAGEDIPETKPSPRPFLLAAEMIDVKPSECVMVGDDPVNDVAGAKGAGMTAVLLDRSGGKACPVKPDHVIKSLNQLLDLLPIWEGGQSF